MMKDGSRVDPVTFECNWDSGGNSWDKDETALGVCECKFIAI